MASLSPTATTTPTPTPTPTQEPHKIPGENNTQKHKKAAMEKYKDAVIKLMTTDPNTPLAPTQMTILEDRLTFVFSQFRTPNHPPYAAMIQRALQELNQKGGSGLESISQFIRMEYDDLPWAHFTLLKHHLRLLCESGEVVVTRGPRYSLAGASIGLGSKKCRKKHRKKRWRWDWERRRSKRRKTEYEKLQLEDEFEVIEEPRPLDVQQSHVPGNQKNEKENGQIRGSQLGTENGISSDSRVLATEPLLLTGGDEFHAEAGVQQEEKCEPRNVEMIGFCDPHAQEQQERKPNEDDELEPLSPERSPGFEFMRVKLTKCQEQTTQDLHPVEIRHLLVATKTDLLAAPNNSENHPLPQGHEEALQTSKVVDTHLQQKIQLCDGSDQLKQHEFLPANAVPIDLRAELLEIEKEQLIKTDNSLEALDREQILEDQHSKIMLPQGPPCVNQNLHRLLPVTTSATVSINMQQIEPGEHLASSSLEGSPKICGRMRQMQLESTSETGSPSFLEKHKQEQHGDAGKPSDAENIEIVELSCTLRQIKEMRQQKKNWQHQRKQDFEQQLKQRMVVLALPLQQKENQLLDIEHIEEKPPCVNSLKSPLQKNKQYFRKKRMSCQKKEMKTKDVTVVTDLTTPELESGTIKASSKTQKDPKHLNQDSDPLLRDLERVSGLESLGTQESSQTERMERQLRRWSGKRPKPRPSSELSENNTLVEMLLLDVEKPQEQKQTPSELTQVTEQRAKLRSWRKKNEAQPQGTTDALSSSMDLQQKKLTNNHICVKGSPEPELREDLQPLLQKKLTGQEMPSRRVLRPHPLQPESVSSANLDKLPPSDNQREQQHQTDYQGQGRPPKAKPEATMEKLAVSDIQYKEHQQTMKRGQGRPPSSKPDATMDKLASESQFEELHRTGYRLRGRPPNEKLDTKLLRESTSSIHQNQQDTNRTPRYEDQQQRKYRRLGRPPKAEVDNIVVRELTPPDYQNQQLQKQAKRRGRCMPPEENSEATIAEVLSLHNAMCNSKQQQQLEQSKDRQCGRPSKPKLNVDTGKKNLSSSKRKPRKPSRGRSQKTE